MMEESEEFSKEIFNQIAAIFQHLSLLTAKT